MKKQIGIVTFALLTSILACTLGETTPQTSEVLETSEVSTAGATSPTESQPGPPPPPSGQVTTPADLEYLGAFRLPGGKDRPQTFAYGGNAMTFNPNGDPAGAADGFPGSFFISGHDRMPYGDLPDGGQIAEVSIPAPSPSRSLADLPQAEFLQNFQDVLELFADGAKPLVHVWRER